VSTALSLTRYVACARIRKGRNGPARPCRTRAAILKVVDADPAPPRVFFGELPNQVVPAFYQRQHLATWAEWNSVAREAEGKQRHEREAPWGLRRLPDALMV
jgi:hypothetical protein